VDDRWACVRYRSNIVPPSPSEHTEQHVLTLDDKIAAEGAALGRTLKAHDRCMYKAGGPTLVDAAERADAESALALAKANFAALLLERPRRGE
jgi:hypothetical protein